MCVCCFVGADGCIPLIMLVHIWDLWWSVMWVNNPQSGQRFNLSHMAVHKQVYRTQSRSAVQHYLWARFPFSFQVSAVVPISLVAHWWAHRRRWLNSSEVLLNTGSLSMLAYCVNRRTSVNPIKWFMNSFGTAPSVFGELPVFLFEPASPSR